ncbi:MAG: hypothetical protein K8J31_24345 [Anaerolineae bacterium]|nr:hypothetical protein [Anaerolineae bacterium]
MNNTLLALIIGLGFGLVLGYFVARSSARREKIYGGQVAQIFHYIGAAAVTGVLPVVIASLVLRGGFGLAFPLAVSFMVSGFLALILFAIVEQPARSQVETRGWTEQDARTSGL